METADEDNRKRCISISFHVSLLKAPKSSMIFIVIITIVFNFLHAYSISRRTSSTTFTLAFAILTASGTVAARKCQDIIVPIHIQALQPTYDIPIPQNNLDVVDFILNLTQQSSRFTVTAQTGHHTTSGCYNISAKFCQSDYGSQFPTVQVLTHGIGFDKSYWDLPYDAYHYSYINYALNRGYSTLSYDRLGIGGSSHGEPLNEIQSFLEVEALKSLTEKLRSGSLLDVLHSEQVPKIVHVGHSFGSALTYALANLYPQLTDAIVLTGFSMNSSFIDVFTAGGNFALANKNQPFRFGDLNSQQALQTYLEPVADYLAPAVDFSSLSPSQNLPNGYLITSNAESNKYQFLKPKYFDPRFLIELERTKQPVTLGELLTSGTLTKTNAFTGPVLAISGDADLPYCGSDCLATGGVAASIPAQLIQNFPSVDPENFTAYIQPNTGHAINLHYNSTGAYAVIHNFFTAKMLQSS